MQNGLNQMDSCYLLNGWSECQMQLGALMYRAPDNFPH